LGVFLFEENADIVPKSKVVDSQLGQKMLKPELPKVIDLSKREGWKGKSKYRLDYTDPHTGKRVRRPAFTVQQDALQFASNLYNKWKAEYLDDPRPEEVELVTLTDLIDSYLRLKEGRVKPRSYRRYEIYATNVKDFFRNNMPSVVNAKDLTKAHFEEYMKYRLANAITEKTVNAELQFVKSAFEFAIDEKRLDENPIRTLAPYRVPPKRVQYWEKEELEEIFNAAPVGYRDAYEFLSLTGLRKGELIHLTWNDVRLGDNPHIMIQPKPDWEPKTSTQRMIPLHPRAVQLIEKQDMSDKHNYVFKAPQGGKIHPDHILRNLKTTLDKLRLEGNLHKFRSSFASHLVMANVGIETVSKLLGHSNILMTMKYAYLAPYHLKEAVMKLDFQIDDTSRGPVSEGQEQES